MKAKEQTGRGEIRIPYTESNKEEQRTNAEKIIAAAIADSINATLEDSVLCQNSESPYGIDKERLEFILTFPQATGSQMKKYNDMS